MNQPAHETREPEQVRHESAMNDVAAVILNLEHAISRAAKALKRMGDAPEEHNARLALEDALSAMKSTRKRLERDAYFDGGSLRLV